MYSPAVLYQVAKGDTILSICQEHGLTWRKFVELNPSFDVMGHRDPGVIYVGEMFVVGFCNEDPIQLIREK